MCLCVCARARVCVLSNSISRSELKDKMSDDDAKVLTTAVEDALAWLESEGESASTQDFEAKQKVSASIALGSILYTFLSQPALEYKLRVLRRDVVRNRTVCRRWRTSSTRS